MTLVIDASVAVKLIVEEAGTAQASALLDGGDALIAPDWLKIEVASALWQKVRDSQLLAIHAERGLRAIEGVFEQMVPAIDLADTAFLLSLRLRHPVYDCLYLALGLASEATVVTADRKFFRAAERSGFADRFQLLTWDEHD